MPLGRQSQKTEHQHGALFSLVGATSPNPLDKDFIFGYALFQRFLYNSRYIHFQKTTISAT
jgi:hypothetical protein